MGRVSAHIQDVIGRIYQHDSPETLRAMGIDVILGPARFTGPHTVEVNGRVVRGRRFLICTGSRPAVPAIPGWRMSVPDLRGSLLASAAAQAPGDRGGRSGWR